MALTDIDRNLLQRCLSGSPEGWRDFVNRFLGLFIHVVQHSAQSRSLTVSSEDVEDLCAEVFLALLDRDFAILRQFRGNASLATYLCVISRRIIVRQLAQRRSAEAFGHISVSEAVLESIGANSSDIQRIEDQEHVGLMLDGLAEPEASIIRQFHLEGRSYREISDDLGIPENSIGPTLTRARARLRSRQVKL
ncbi:MAG: sigma-70 family RNA polymerase sigma factor [Planctomycetota bacterium]|nr:sigma-70 family RNA polymerase sigma factor [Planctomycetota bacterium]